MTRLLAQSLQNPVLNVRLGQAIDVSESPAMLQLLLRLLIDMIFIIAGLWFFIQIILGGYNFITSAGDKEAVQKSQRRIQQAVIGLVIIFAVFALASVIQKVFGFNLVNFTFPHP